MLEAEKLANADDDYVLHHTIRQIRQVNEEIADVNRRIRAMARRHEGRPSRHVEYDGGTASVLRLPSTTCKNEVVKVVPVFPS